MKKEKERKLKNGVLHPAEKSISGELWLVADKLKKRLRRNPARFEFRAAVAKEKRDFNHESVSYQWFLWRKFHGIIGHSSNRYPKRGTFKPSAKTVERLKTKKK